MSVVTCYDPVSERGVKMEITDADTFDPAVGYTDLGKKAEKCLHICNTCESGGFQDAKLCASCTTCSESLDSDMGISSNKGQNKAKHVKMKSGNGEKGKSELEAILMKQVRWTSFDDMWETAPCSLHCGPLNKPGACNVESPVFKTKHCRKCKKCQLEVIANQIDGNSCDSTKDGGHATCNKRHLLFNTTAEMFCQIDKIYEEDGPTEASSEAAPITTGTCKSCAFCIEHSDSVDGMCPEEFCSNWVREKTRSRRLMGIYTTDMPDWKIHPTLGNVWVKNTRDDFLPYPVRLQESRPKCMAGEVICSRLKHAPPKEISGVNTHVDESSGPNGVMVESIRVQDITPDIFFNRYLKQAKPLVIKGGARSWPALLKWTDKDLLSKLENATVNAERSTSGQYGFAANGENVDSDGAGGVTGAAWTQTIDSSRASNEARGLLI